MFFFNSMPENHKSPPVPKSCYVCNKRWDDWKAVMVYNCSSQRVDFGLALIFLQVVLMFGDLKEDI